MKIARLEKRELEWYMFSCEPNQLPPDYVHEENSQSIVKGSRKIHFVPCLYGTYNVCIDNKSCPA